ncbi:MAG: PBP1A family penicillin-binding protein [Pseudomonadota bacterium]
MSAASPKRPASRGAKPGEAASEAPRPKRAPGKRADRPPTGPGLVERTLRRVFGLALRLAWRVGWRVSAVVAVVVALATGYQFAALPPLADLLDGRDKGSVLLLDRNGTVFAWRGDQYGGALTATDVSPHLIDAIIATEDRRFWQHPGIDPIGIARAILVNIQAGDLVQGGSTLTQQAAKVVFLDYQLGWSRKLREIPLALAMELKYDKADILSIYLNRVYLGAGTYGFEAAAQRYFAKSAREVTPAEAAMLAGLLKAPSRYAPTSNLAAAQNRAAVIVGLMRAQGFLTDAQAAEALANPAQLSQAAADRAGGYFADWVMSAGPNYLTRATTEDVEVRTTFDPKIQRAAEEALAQVFATKVREGSQAQAAIVVLSRDGAVRALVGGREITPQAGQFNRATMALRQTGSIFKPVIYAAALAAGWSPQDRVLDAPLTLNVPGSGRWSPQNYSRLYLGEITLTEALARSVNTAAVRVSEELGRQQVLGLARALGISGKFAPGPAIALGTTEAPLIEMAGVYATFLNAGRKVTPYGLLEIRLRGANETLLGMTDRVESNAVLPAPAAGQIVAMLQTVIEEGTGRRAAVPGYPLAGKTGTTSAARDAWFIGFSADHVVAVWMGYDNNAPLTGVTGGGLPAEIFREVMARLLAGTDPRPLPSASPAPPSGLQLAQRTPEDAEAESILSAVLRGLGLDADTAAEPPPGEETDYGDR